MKLHVPIGRNDSAFVFGNLRSLTASNDIRANVEGNRDRTSALRTTMNVTSLGLACHFLNSNLYSDADRDTHTRP